MVRLQAPKAEGRGLPTNTRNEKIGEGFSSTVFRGRVVLLTAWFQTSGSRTVSRYIIVVVSLQSVGLGHGSARKPMRSPHAPCPLSHRAGSHPLHACLTPAWLGSQPRGVSSSLPHSPDWPLAQPRIMTLGSFSTLQTRMNRMWTSLGAFRIKPKVHQLGRKSEEKPSKGLTFILACFFVARENGLFARSRGPPGRHSPENSLWSEPSLQEVCISSEMRAICHRGHWLSVRRQKRKGRGPETAAGLSLTFSRSKQGINMRRALGEEDHSDYSRMPVVCLVSLHSPTL